MLDKSIKQRINNARQVLVGIVPNPEAQVQQITTALIYKFMDDMDRENEEIERPAVFLVKDLKEFSWNRLMSPELSGEQRLDLYIRALVAFEESKRIPDFFKTIFKGSILPHRDSKVLHLFLKEIDGFTYTDNSENLGNAFEYLLSIMGSQGDAGQFRTPRHIIDFVVEVVDPKKGERILDPACGTAGFLISSYKHIRKQNSSNYSPKTDIPTFAQTDNKEINDLQIQSNGKYKGDELTPDDRKKMAKNIHGYDVAPEMVRLSKVNMYLHGFKTPQIHVYNTLASDSRWDEYFDVILANPPFMTPKGGIQPHKRFQVQANRSEVLFVDYIAEHLNIKGRAGIIVPEGIIFQSANAYKDLRKNLVEDWGLWAVVSLPSGVFQPYSGVKTSILFLDKDIAKKTNKILFVKIENDGFDLGAQRRKVDKNNLPEAFDILEKWKNKQKLVKTKIAHAVKKSKIADSRDYNLTSSRYLETVDYSNVKWDMVELGEICDLESGSRQKGGAVDSGVYSIGGEQISKDNAIRFEKMKYITEAHFLEMKKGVLSKGDVLMVKDGATTGKMGFWNYDYRASVNEHVFMFRAKDRILPKYLYNVLLSDSFQYELKPYIKGIIGGISLEIKKIKIPIPPLEIQKQIVAELDDYQKVINGAKQVIENWKPQIKFSSEWRIVRLGEICKKITKGTTPTTNGFRFENSGVNFIKIESIEESGKFLPEKFKFISNETNNALKRSWLKDGDILFSIAGALGRVAIVNERILPANINQALAIIRLKSNISIDREFLFNVLKSKLILDEILKLKVGVAQYNLSLSQIADIKIPLPSLEVQKQIVAEINIEKEVVEQNKKLIEIFERKIKKKISEVWGE
ncbi:N-6 DNA methylase [Patescibacteria group bacterium AH-259-L07]|nr:N-6 DNA methylase [Patescibacteria group bacterium AH-259-L07]